MNISIATIHWFEPYSHSIFFFYIFQWNLLAYSHRPTGMDLLYSDFCFCPKTNWSCSMFMGKRERTYTISSVLKHSIDFRDRSWNAIEKNWLQNWYSCEINVHVLTYVFSLSLWKHTKEIVAADLTCGTVAFLCLLTYTTLFTSSPPLPLPPQLPHEWNHSHTLPCRTAYSNDLINWKKPKNKSTQ